MQSRHDDDRREEIPMLKPSRVVTTQRMKETERVRRSNLTQNPKLSTCASPSQSHVPGICDARRSVGPPDIHVSKPTCFSSVPPHRTHPSVRRSARLSILARMLTCFRKENLSPSLQGDRRNHFGRPYAALSATALQCLVVTRQVHVPSAEAEMFS
jgi:hypothetical protein